MQIVVNERERWRECAKTNEHLPYINALNLVRLVVYFDEALSDSACRLACPLGG